MTTSPACSSTSGSLAPDDALVVDLELDVPAVAVAPLDLDLLGGPVGEPAGAGDGGEQGDALRALELDGARLVDLAEAEHGDGDLGRDVDDVVGEDRDVGVGVGPHHEVVDGDVDLVGQPVLGAAQDVDGVAVLVGQAAGGGERLEQRPAPREGEVAGLLDRADDRDRLGAELADLDGDRGALHVLGLEQGLEALRELDVGQAGHGDVVDQRQVDRAFLADAPLDVELRHLEDLDLQEVLGADPVARAGRPLGGRGSRLQAGGHAGDRRDHQGRARPPRVCTPRRLSDHARSSPRGPDPTTILRLVR